MKPKQYCNERLLIKNLLLMKLSFAIIFFTCLQVSAKEFHPHNKITLKMRQAAINDIFKTIEKNTPYRFVYSNDYFPVDFKVNVDVKEMPVAIVVSSMLEKTACTFKMLDENTFDIMKTAAEANVSIHGRVTTENGDPLEGVTVSTDNPVSNAITNSTGRYTITADENATITFSFVGYETQAVPVNGRTVINTSLKQTSSSLADVVVIGYGTVKKSDLTGSVATVSSKDVERVPTGNLVTALEGQVAGVQIMQASGAREPCPLSKYGEQIL